LGNSTVPRLNKREKKYLGASLPKRRRKGLGKYPWKGGGSRGLKDNRIGGRKVLGAK